MLGCVFDFTFYDSPMRIIIVNSNAVSLIANIIVAINGRYSLIPSCSYQKVLIL